MKTFLVIGAGEYGSHLAVNLCKMGNEVMLVDKNENIIDDLEFFYIGKKADLSEDAFPEKSYLGYQSSSCYQESNTINKIEKNT